MPPLFVAREGVYEEIVNLLPLAEAQNDSHGFW